MKKSKAPSVMGEFQQILASKDLELTAQFLSRLPSANRPAVASLAAKYHQALAESRVPKEGIDVLSGELSVLCTCDDRIIRRLPWPTWRKREALLPALKKLRPASLGVWAEILLSEVDGCYAFFVRDMIEARLCDPPRHLVINALLSATVLCGSYGEPPLSQLLKKMPGLLKREVWEIFETEGLRAYSLSNHPTWGQEIIRLGAAGRLSHDRLLDESLATVWRAKPGQASWFTRFHDNLKPTPAQRVARLDAYLKLLGHDVPAVASYAIKTLKQLGRLQSIPAEVLVRHLEPALQSKTKKAVIGALDLLEQAVKNQSALTPMAAALASRALAHEAPDVQKRVFDLLEKLDHSDDELRSRLNAWRDHVRPSLRGRLARWCDAPGVPSVSRPKPAPGKAVAEDPRSAVRALDSKNAIVPIGSFDELVERAAYLLEHARDLMEMERVWAALVRLTDRPADFERRVAPIRKRAESLRGKWANDIELSEYRDLAVQSLLCWCTNRRFGRGLEGADSLPYLQRRLDGIQQAILERHGRPLLATPTHRGGWIQPRALVERALIWQKAGTDGAREDQVPALLRLSLEDRESAREVAGGLAGEFGDALRYTLGDSANIGPSRELWAAAARARSPDADAPEVERRHAGAGVVPVYTWDIRPDAGQWKQYRSSEERKRPACYMVHVSCKPPESGKADSPLEVMRSELNSAHGSWTDLQDWWPILAPARHEDGFAQAVGTLSFAINWSGSLVTFTYSLLAALSESLRPLGPMGRLLLAIGLGAKDPRVSSLAREAFIAHVEKGLLETQAVGADMARLLHSKLMFPANRWTRQFTDIARVSSAHAEAIRDLAPRILRGNPADAPSDLTTLLEFIHEVFVDAGESLSDSEALNYLSRIQAGGKTGRLAAALLNAAK